MTGLQGFFYAIARGVVAAYLDELALRKMAEQEPPPTDEDWARARRVRDAVRLLREREGSPP